MMDMYDFSLMPTINEDAVSARGSFSNGDEGGIEHLMVNMLDERDKLMEALNNSQEQLSDCKIRIAELEKENESLQNQLDTSLPQVFAHKLYLLSVHFLIPPLYRGTYTSMLTIQ